MLLDQVVAEANTRSIPVGKNTLKAVRSDPFGHWTIHFERGEIPKELSGAFTSFNEAWKVMEMYLQRRKDEEAKVEAAEPTPAPTPIYAPEIPAPTEPPSNTLFANEEQKEVTTSGSP